VRHICPDCKKPMTRKIDEYHYKESGLDNVYLKNTIVYECPCGVSYPSVFRMPFLNDLIVDKLFEKPALLNGKEIRFIRKSLLMPSKVFSKKLGVGFTTYSKWENDRQTHSDMNDRLIRTTALIYQGKDPKNAARIINQISEIKLIKSDYSFHLIAKKVEDDYRIVWKNDYEARTDKSDDVVEIGKPSLSTFSDRDDAINIYKNWKVGTNLYRGLLATGTNNT